jgi:hypothetical protein
MNATLIYAENPAANRMPRVRFIEWFDEDRRYARVEFPSGRILAVPAPQLIKI